MIDVAPQHLETGVRRRVKDGNVMLLENIAYLRLGEIYNCRGGLTELLRRRSKISGILLTHRQWAYEHQEAIVGGIGREGFADGGKKARTSRCARGIESIGQDRTAALGDSGLSLFRNIGEIKVDPGESEKFIEAKLIMSDYVLFEQEEHIAYITINRPERMNALDQDVRKGLIDAFMKVRYEPSIRVAIITGAGDKAFSAGADLKEHNEIFKKKSYRVGPDYGALDEPPHSSAIVIETYKPVIAAVNGYALAGGCELAREIITGKENFNVCIAAERLTDGRFPETSRWESRALLPCSLLQRRRLRLQQRTGGRCLNYLESRWSLPPWLDLGLFQTRALSAQERRAKRDAPRVNRQLALDPF
jgi:hypothetical protein